MLRFDRIPAIRARAAGSVAALVAVLMPVVVGVMALALDGGMLYLQRQTAQSVADAAALAGAYQLYNGSNFSVAQSRGDRDRHAERIHHPAVERDLARSRDISRSRSRPASRGSSAPSGGRATCRSRPAPSPGEPISPTRRPPSSSWRPRGPRSRSRVRRRSPRPMAASWSIRPRPSSILSSGSPSITTPELDLSGGIRYSGSNPNNATVTKTGQASTPDPAGEHLRSQLQRHDRPEQLDDRRSRAGPRRSIPASTPAASR